MVVTGCCEVVEYTQISGAPIRGPKGLSACLCGGLSASSVSGLGVGGTLAPSADDNSDAGAVEGDDDRDMELFDDEGELGDDGHWPQSPGPGGGDEPGVEPGVMLPPALVGGTEMQVENLHSATKGIFLYNNNNNNHHHHHPAHNGSFHDGQDDRPEVVKDWDQLCADDDDDDPDGRPAKKISSGAGTPIPMPGPNGYGAEGGSRLSTPSNERLAETGSGGHTEGCATPAKNNADGDSVVKASRPGRNRSDDAWPSSDDDEEEQRRRQGGATDRSTGDGDSSQPHRVGDGASSFGVTSSSSIKNGLFGSTNGGFSSPQITTYGGRSSPTWLYSSRPRGRGLTGLANLGNTCFMNSALQCLSNTCPLREYFFSGEYVRDINKDNPIGTGGELAKAFANLLIQLWKGDETSVYPRNFKTALGRHAEQFMGYDQQDSQELIAYLLDGIHEDLNRVEAKPYEDKVEASGDEGYHEVADRAWNAHLARNDSRVVEIFQGQYKSIITCPLASCGHVSITFDPFMYLSVPVPADNTYGVNVYYYPPTLGQGPVRYVVKIHKNSVYKDLRQGLSRFLDISPQDLCLVEISYHRFNGIKEDKDRAPYEFSDSYTVCGFSLSGQEEAAEADRRLVAENPDWEEKLAPFLRNKVDDIYNKKTFFRECTSILVKGSPPPFVSSNFTTAAEDKEKLPVLQKYLGVMTASERLKKFGSCEMPYAVAVQFHKRSYYYSTYSDSTDEAFEACVLLINPQQDDVATLKRKAFLWLKHRLKRPMTPTMGGEAGSSEEEETKGEDRRVLREHKTESVWEEDDDSWVSMLNGATTLFSITEFTYQTPVKIEGEDVDRTKVMDWVGLDGRIKVVFEDGSFLNHFNTNNVDKICVDDPSVAAQEEQDKKGWTLYDCIQAFMKKEQLEASDMWYCSKCAAHRQAWKEMALWSTPPILVIHLKRFHYDGHWRDKIETKIDFPLEGLDLTDFILDKRKVDKLPPVYDLYAVSNHSGSLHGGHYTAHARNPFDLKWYHFDDSHVDEVRRPNDEVVSSYAYVLFYRRRDVVTLDFADPVMVVDWPSIAPTSPVVSMAGANNDEEEEEKTVLEAEEEDEEVGPLRRKRGGIPMDTDDDEDFSALSTS